MHRCCAGIGWPRFAALWHVQPRLEHQTGRPEFLRVSELLRGHSSPLLTGLLHCSLGSGLQMLCSASL